MRNANAFVTSPWGLALLACLIVLGTAHAGDGKIPIWKESTISASGNYILTTNITDDTGIAGPPIKITGTDLVVNLDLNNFTVTQDSGAAGEGVIDSDGAKRLVIHNGSVVRGSAGSSGPAIRIRNAGGSGVVVESVATDGGDAGIRLENVGAYRLESNQVSNISGSGDWGIRIENTSNNPKGEILKNAIVNSAGGIRVVGGKNLDIKSNSIALDSANTNRGIEIFPFGATGFFGLVIEDNHVTNGTDGIYVSGGSSCRVEGNHAAAGSGTGYRFPFCQGCEIEDNEAHDWGVDGMRIEQSVAKQNHISANHLTNNGRIGLFIEAGSDNYVGDNTSRGNMGAVAGAPCNNSQVTPNCRQPDYCDNGTGTIYRGDNHMPGPTDCEGN